MHYTTTLNSVFANTLVLQFTNNIKLAWENLLVDIYVTRLFSYCKFKERKILKAQNLFVQKQNGLGNNLTVVVVRRKAVFSCAHCTHILTNLYNRKKKNNKRIIIEDSWANIYFASPKKKCIFFVDDIEQWCVPVDICTLRYSFSTREALCLISRNLNWIFIVQYSCKPNFIFVYLEVHLLLHVTWRCVWVCLCLCLSISK